MRAVFPDLGGFSRANLMYMRAFAEAWTEEEIVQQPVGQIPFERVIVKTCGSRSFRQLRRPRLRQLFLPDCPFRIAPPARRS
ncbi:MAG: hypothetical protein J2P25_24155 [Nocardiopsaceae bacterium]|nr:hypothetical protein [Nocardiopsaceae bacterium]